MNEIVTADELKTVIENEVLFDYFITLDDGNPNPRYNENTFATDVIVRLLGVLRDVKRAKAKRTKSDLYYPYAMSMTK